MIYLALDTCVWLNIIKHDPHGQVSLFNEILFWIEHKHMVCITTPNLIKEWNRNKVTKKNEILNEVKNINRALVKSIESNPSISTALQPDNMEMLVDQRIARIDNMFALLAIEAKNEETIYEEAIKRSLNCIAPNCKQDSFRDTVNILHLLSFVKEKRFSPCYFATSNYKDFSADGNRLNIHSQLETEFSQAGLQYIYFQDEPKHFANKFKTVISAHQLPAYSDFLTQEKIKKQEQVLAERKMKEKEQMNILDPDFINYSQHIDLIIASKEVSDINKLFLDILFQKHPKYKEYFMKKLGENGLV